jgi:hypothetical protein
MASALSMSTGGASQAPDRERCPYRRQIEGPEIYHFKRSHPRRRDTSLKVPKVGREILMLTVHQEFAHGRHAELWRNGKKKPSVNQSLELCYEIMNRNSANNPQNSGGPILNAIKLGPGDIGTSPKGNVYFAVKTALPGEQCASPRRRTRLRSGIIFDPASAYFVDSQLYDCSITGAHLRLFSNVHVPFRIRLFDEVAKRLADAIVVWRRHREIGIRFAPSSGPRELTAAERARLRTRYFSAKH